MNWDITSANRILFSPLTNTSNAGGGTTSTSESPSIWSNKKTNTNNTQENQTKYWSAAMQVHPYRDEIYSEITKLTGINDYNNFPPEAKSIADKMNNFCNNMTAGKMASAMQSANIDEELKSLLDEVKNYRDECINELSQLYSKDKGDNSAEINPFAQQDNPFFT